MALAAFGTAATVIGLVTTCLDVAKTLNDLHSRFERAPKTIATLHSEVLILSTNLSELGHLIQTDPHNFETKFSVNATGGPNAAVPPDVALRNAIKGSETTMSSLQKRMEEFSAQDSGGHIAGKIRAKFLWSESDIQESLETTRRLQQAIATLLAILQSRSLSDIQTILQDHSALLKQVVGRFEAKVSDAQLLDIPLRDAVAAGNVQLVEKHLDSGANIECSHEPFNFRAVHYAAWNKRAKVLQILLDRGADKTAVSNLGYTPLHIAANAGDTEAAELLLNAGADVNSDTSHDLTVLQYAVKMGHMSLLKMLIDWKADVETLSKTPLQPRAIHVAVEFKQVEAAKVLIEYGKADPNAELQTGGTALHMAVIAGDTEMTEVLVRAGVDVNTPDHNSIRPLHYAVMGGHQFVVSYLLDKGVDLSARTKIGYSALHCAARVGNGLLIDYLLKAGMNVEDQDNELNTSLHIAAAFGHQAAIKTLVEHGASLLAIGQSHDTPLLAAVRTGERSTAEMLLDYGADMHATDLNHNRPLNLCAIEGYTSIARLLIDRGADVNKPGYHGWRPIHHAAAYGQKNVLQLLLERGVDIHARTDDEDSSAIHLAAKEGQAATITELIIAGVPVEAEDSKGRRPIHLAAANQDGSALATLLHHGVQIDVVSNRLDLCRTPLHVAAQSGSAQNVKLLLDAGARTEARDLNGDRAVDLTIGLGSNASTTALLKNAAGMKK